MAADSSQTATGDQRELNIPWTDVVRFVRQLSHDLRNNLNAIELQSAFVGELVEDAEAKSEVKRLRGMASELGATLQKVTSAMAPITLHHMPYKAIEFVEDLRQKLGSDAADAAKKVDWHVNLGDEMLNIDPQLLQQAFVELFANAFRHGRTDGNLTARVNTSADAFVFTLEEPKANFTEPTTDWGTRPLLKLGHGHYGLGLYRAHSILEAHSGTLHAQYDPDHATLVTTVRLPVSTSGD